VTPDKKREQNEQEERMRRQHALKLAEARDARVKEIQAAERKELERAAVKIQTVFRKHRCQREYRALQSQEVAKIKFVQQLYSY
jgi:IQ calmodulin-binding motif